MRGDFEEGFQIYGEHGSVTGKVHLPWFHKSSIVECFSTKDRQFHRPLGEDAYTYKLQIESFASAILDDAPLAGAGVDDGLASLRGAGGHRPLGRDRPAGRAGRDEGCRRMRLGIFAKTFARPGLPEILAAVKSQGLDCVQFNLACVGLETVPARFPPAWRSRSAGNSPPLG